MKHYNHLLIAALAIMAAGACSVREDAGQARRAIRFTTNLERFAVKATGSSFEKDDSVSLFAGDPINDYNVKMTYNRGQLIPEHEVCWPEDIAKSTAVPFFAFYPYSIGWDETADSRIFSVNADQSTHALYTASDLMTAFYPAYPDCETVPLNFVHRLCRFELSVLMPYTDNVSEVYIADVFGKVRVSLDLDLAVSTVGERGTIRMGKISEDWQGDGRITTWNAILPAQNMHYKIIVTTVSGKTVNYNVNGSLGRNYMEAGHQYSGFVDLIAEVPESDILVSTKPWSADNDEQFGPDLIGSDELWSVFIPSENRELRLAPVEEGIYSLDFEYAGGEFVLRSSRSWAQYLGSKESIPTLDYADAAAGKDYSVSLEPSGYGIRLSDAGLYTLDFNTADTTLVVTLRESYSAGSLAQNFDKYLGKWTYADEYAYFIITISAGEGATYNLNINGYPVQARFDRATGGFEVYYQRAAENTMDYEGTELLLYDWLFAFYLDPYEESVGALCGEDAVNTVVFSGKIGDDGSSIVISPGRYGDCSVYYVQLRSIVQTEAYAGKYILRWGPMVLPQTWKKSE